MYSAKVTSYWYFFFCTHLAKSVGCERRKATADTENRPRTVYVRVAWSENMAARLWWMYEIPVMRYVRISGYWLVRSSNACMFV